MEDSLSFYFFFSFQKKKIAGGFFFPKQRPISLKIYVTMLFIFILLEVTYAYKRCPARGIVRVGNDRTCRDISLGSRKYDDEIYYVDSSKLRLTGYPCDWRYNKKTLKDIPNDNYCGGVPRMTGSSEINPCGGGISRTRIRARGIGTQYQTWLGCPYERVLDDEKAPRYFVITRDEDDNLIAISPLLPSIQDTKKIQYDTWYAAKGEKKVAANAAELLAIPTETYKFERGSSSISVQACPFNDTVQSFAQGLNIWDNGENIEGIEFLCSGDMQGYKTFTPDDQPSGEPTMITCNANDEHVIFGFFNFIKEPFLKDLGIFCGSFKSCHDPIKKFEPDGRGSCVRIQCECDNGFPESDTCTSTKPSDCKNCTLGYELQDSFDGKSKSCNSMGETSTSCTGGRKPIECLLLFQDQDVSKAVTNQNNVTVCWSPACNHNDAAVVRLQENGITCVRPTDHVYYTYPEQIRVYDNVTGTSDLRDTCVLCGEGGTGVTNANTTSARLFMGESQPQSCNTTHCTCPHYNNPFRCVRKDVMSLIPIGTVCDDDTCDSGYLPVNKVRNDDDKFRACADKNECLENVCGFDSTNTSLNLCVNTVGSHECDLICDLSSSLIQNGDDRYCECVTGYYPDSSSKTQKILGIDPSAFCLSCADIDGNTDPTCSSHGTCVPPIISFTRPTCQCDPGYGGYLCEIPLEHNLDCSQDLGWTCVPEPVLAPSVVQNPQLLFQNAWQCSTREPFTIQTEHPSNIQLHFQKAVVNEVQLYGARGRRRWSDQELCFSLWTTFQEEGAKGNFEDQVELNRNGRTSHFLESSRRASVTFLSVRSEWPWQNLWPEDPESDLDASLWALEKYALCPFPFNTDVYRGNDTLSFAPCSLPIQNKEEGWFFTAQLAPGPLDGGNAFCYLLDAYARGRHEQFGTTSGFPYRCKGFISQRVSLTNTTRKPVMFVDCVVQPPLPPHQIDNTSTAKQRALWIKSACLSS